MLVEDAINYINRIKYKPNYKIRAGLSYLGDEFIEIKLQYKAPDATKPDHQIIKLSGMRSLDIDWIETITPKELTDAVFNLIIGWEKHEAGEWFEIDGNKPFYPHEDHPPETRPKEVL